MTEITGEEFMSARLRYYDLLRKLPQEARSSLPPFARFISPANYSMINEHEVLRHDFVILSITGEQRMELLASPHAATLLRAYAAQKKG